MISPDIKETSRIPDFFQKILDDNDPFKNFNYEN